MKFADPKPGFCSACYQHSTGEHVDFEASWDGPVLEDGKTKVKVSVDELILCEDCVRRAAELFGMEEPRNLKTLVAGLEAEVAALRDELSAKDDMLADLTYSVILMDRYPIPKKHGRRKTEGVSEETKKHLASAQRRSEGQKKTKENANA